MSDFCQRMWGFHMGGHGVKYWEAINALNTAYEGIKPDDFVEMNLWWDECGISFMREKEMLKAPKYSLVKERKQAHSKDFFDTHAKGIASDCRKHWKPKCEAEQHCHQDHAPFHPGSPLQRIYV